MAMILTKAPAALKGLRVAIEGLATAANRAEACEKIATQVNFLKDALDPAKGHAAQRLAQAANAMVKGSGFEPNVIRTLGQVAEVIGSLLDPRLFKKAGEAQPSRALLIENDKEVLESASAALRVAEVRATAFADATQAFDILKKEAFDVILFNSAMPGLNTAEFCGKIREISQHRTTPIVLITANGAENQGGDDFIAKPFSSLELVTKTTTWVARHQFGLKA
jgi:CheY-like chemotaxis protein